MIRIAMTALMLLTAWGCDGGSPRFTEGAGTPAAFAAERPWRFETVAVDTVQTVTRRVWFGPLVDPLGAPSPDGRHLVHTNWLTGDIAIRDVQTGETRHLTQNTAPYQPGFGMLPRFSPDGRRVVYAWWRQEQPYDWQLRVVEVAGSEPRVIYGLEPTPWIQAEDWSPDGTTILAARVQEDGTTQGLLVSDEDGSVQVLKTFEWRASSGQEGRASFSPDGRYIVYDFPPGDGRTDRDLYVLAADGSRETRLVDHPANDFVLGWAPDGSVLFGSDRTGTPGAWLLPVRDGRPSGAPALVKPDLWRAHPLGFTRGGAFFYSVQTGGRDIYTATLDPATGRVLGLPVPLATRSLGSSSWPSWSPDGRHLAYLISRIPGPGEPRATALGIRSIEIGDVREINLPLELTYPYETEWTPDGRGVVVRSPDRAPRHGLYRVDLQTGTTEPLFRLPALHAINSFELTRDGGSAVLAVNRRTEEGQAEWKIVIRDLAGGFERELFGLAVPTTEQIRSLALSPDGETLAFAIFRGNDPRSIMVQPMAGGAAREILHQGAVGSLEWTGDGRALLFSRPDDPGNPENPHVRVWRVGLDADEPEAIGLGMDRLQALDLSPDGRRLAFTAGVQAAEIWVMEDFLPGGGTVGAAPPRR